MIMSEAGKIAVARRKVHRGASLKVFPCRWCQTGIAGRAGLQDHERACASRPDEWPGVPERFRSLLAD
jgi:hypothetical protein